MPNPNIEGLSKNDAITTLISKEGFDLSSANTYWKEHGAKVATGFAGDFYNSLRESPMDNATFDKLIADGSQNVIKHKGHYDAIRQLANDIHGE